MTLREATLDDIPCLRAIAHAAWPEAYRGIISSDQIAYMLERMYGEAVLHRQMAANGHRFMIAGADGTEVGFAGFEHAYRPQRSRLHKLYVLPDRKGTGVGHALLAAVIEEARRSGDLGIELNVNRRNPSTAFYLRHGFSVERDEVLDIGGGYVMDDHVMVRTL